jgi:hypothetical protein
MRQLLPLALLAVAGTANAETVESVHVTAARAEFSFPSTCGHEGALAIRAGQLSLSANTTGATRTANSLGIRSMTEDVQELLITVVVFDADCNTFPVDVDLLGATVHQVTTDGTATDTEFCFSDDPNVDPDVFCAVPGIDIKHDSVGIKFHKTINGQVIDADFTLVAAGQPKVMQNSNITPTGIFFEGHDSDGPVVLRLKQLNDTLVHIREMDYALSSLGGTVTVNGAPATIQVLTLGNDGETFKGDLL